MQEHASASSLVPGQMLGRYRVIEEIGVGGMGRVYRARDERLERDVAVKVLSPSATADPVQRERLRREALTLSQLDHPNLATVYDFASEDGLDFLVMEFVPGATLADHIVQGAMPEKEVIEIAVQVAEALAAAHSRGIVHRDLKPANLKITPEGRVKVLDFGLAIETEFHLNSVTTDADIMPVGGGTPAYMAPERLRGAMATPHCDVYAAGVVLYEMATGRRPFAEQTTALLVDAILNREPIPPRLLRPDLSPRLEEVILRCLEKNPEHRHATGHDLLADLRRTIVAGLRSGATVAVLYLENLSGQKEDEYFRNGITEDITTEISRIKDLRVLSRSAVLPYRDKPLLPSYVGQQLSAAYVVEGSFRREGEHLRLTAKLVETQTGHTMWAERYDRTLQDVFSIQDEIANNVAQALRVVLTKTEREAIGKVPTANVRAYDFYLRGRHFFHQFRRKGFDFAREMFRHAIDIDQDYARAHAGIADCSSFLYMYWDSSAENLKMSDEASRKALGLDPGLAEAHASRGLSVLLKKDYEEAHRELEAAIHLDPKLFWPYYFRARAFYVQGDLKEAVRWFEQASRVDPEDYQAPMLMASALHGLGRAKDAEAAYHLGLAAAEKHLELYPDDSRALYFGANALTQLNEKERALNWAERALQLEPDEHQVLYNVACVYALLGESERAIDCLEQSLTRGWAQHEWMMNDPDLASLCGNPRFEALRSKKARA